MNTPFNITFVPDRRQVILHISMLVLAGVGDKAFRIQVPPVANY